MKEIKIIKLLIVKYYCLYYNLFRKYHIPKRKEFYTASLFRSFICFYMSAIKRNNAKIHKTIFINNIVLNLLFLIVFVLIT